MNYKYLAKDKYGKSVTGVISGEDESFIAKHLSAMGYTPISIEESKEARFGLAKLFEAFKRITLEDLNLFTRQLLTLQKAGIPLLSSLDVLERQTKNRYFKDVLKDMRAHIESGGALSDAMARYPKIFSELYVNMIKSGEASGLLDEILARLAEFGEKDVDTRSKIKAATRYPLITLAALFIAFIIVVTFVIPRFSPIFLQFKTSLPLPTRILLGLSFIMKNYWYAILLVIFFLGFLFFKYINTKNGRLKWDSLKLRLPIFGPLVYMFTMSRFSMTMSILIRSGLPILQVLDMVSRAVGNAAVSRVVDNIVISVRDGKGISGPMDISGIFPPMVVQMVAVGEDTGKIDELLMKVSEYYDQQSDYSIRNLTAMIEPIFVLILGGMVLMMALAIFLPMWNLIRLFRY